MLDQPKVTIVTPTYNRVGLLRQTIVSVLNQTYENIEYIVVNDGSTDSTMALLDEYKDRLTILDKKNSGQVDSLTKGWTLATGDLIGYLSDDDILYPNAIARLVEEYLKHDITCIYPDSDLIDLNGRTIKRSVCRPTCPTELLVNQECYIGPGALFDREAYLSVGPWDSKFVMAPDREFYIRLLSKGKIKFLNEVLAGYRQHPDSSVVKNVNESMMLEYLIVMEKLDSEGFVPSDYRAEAFARANLMVARACMVEGAFGRSIYYWRRASALNSSVVTVRKFVRLMLVYFKYNFINRFNG